MQNVAQTVTTVQFDNALRQMADRARTRYAGEAARLDKGLTIALNHGVTFLEDGTALVKSQSDAEIVYEVKAGRCDCPDAERAPEFRCKHRWAACFTKKATTQIAGERAAQTYYASYVTTDGFELQGTAKWIEAEAGWLFIDTEKDQAYLTHRTTALVLGGRVDILESQRAKDGDLVRKVCGY